MTGGRPPDQINPQQTGLRPENRRGSLLGGNAAAAVGNVHQTAPQDHGNRPVNRPLRISGHEAPRENIDPLQKKDESH